MRTSPLLADFIHARGCKPICAKLLTLPMGMYIYEALCDVSPILHAFAKNGAKPIEYRTEPYPLFGKDKPKEKSEQQEERDALFAKAYMSQMVRAGKSWGKK